MINTASLSLDQAPPISIPFRYFVTAPLFGLAAGLLVLINGPELFLTRWSAQTLGLTHLLTLGMLAMVMAGALLQMCPVIAGSPVPGVVPVGTLVHLMLSLGTLLLVGGFLTGNVLSEHAALTLLALSVLLLVVAITRALFRVKRVSYTVVAMRLAVLALLITMLLGVLLGSGILGRLGFGDIAALVDVHLAWGLLGWIGLLLVGISYQVVPMFQVTPEYPRRLRQWMGPGLFVGILIWTGLRLLALAGLLAVGVADLVLLLVLAGYAVYALFTLRLQRQRKRRVPDITLAFWRVGMGCLLAAALLWCVARLVPGLAQGPVYTLWLGVLLILGVGVSVVNGMLYKIVPFLSWFHLQNRQLKLMCLSVAVPNMKEFVPDRAARLQYRCYLLSLLLALAACTRPTWFAHLAGFVFLLCNGLLLKNLVQAMRRYAATDQALHQAAEDNPQTGGG